MCDESRLRASKPGSAFSQAELEESDFKQKCFYELPVDKRTRSSRTSARVHLAPLSFISHHLWAMQPRYIMYDMDL